MRLSPLLCWKVQFFIWTYWVYACQCADLPSRIVMAGWLQERVKKTTEYWILNNFMWFYVGEMKGDYQTSEITMSDSGFVCKYLLTKSDHKWLNWWLGVLPSHQICLESWVVSFITWGRDSRPSLWVCCMVDWGKGRFLPFFKFFPFLGKINCF